MEDNIFNKVMELEDEKLTILQELSLSLTDENTDKHYSIRANAYKKINKIDATISALFAADTQQRIEFLENLKVSIAEDVQEGVDAVIEDLEQVTTVEEEATVDG